MSNTESKKPRNNEVWLLRVAGLAVLLLVVLRFLGLKPSALATAEKRWNESGTTDYRIQVREIQGTWCYYESSLEVRSGQVVSASITAHLGPAQGCWAYTAGIVEEPVSLSAEEATRWTVPGLFEIAHNFDRLADKGDMKVVLEFDPILGYPSRLFRDNTVAIDDEEGLSVLQFERVGN